LFLRNRNWISLEINGFAEKSKEGEKEVSSFGEGYLFVPSVSKTSKGHGMFFFFESGVALASPWLIPG
jgi:hypothetical protein